MATRGGQTDWRRSIETPPRGWRSGLFKDFFEQRSERGFESLELLSVTASSGLVARNSLARRDTSNEDKSRYLRVCPGDLVYNTMRMWQGVSALCDREGIVSPAYTVCVPKSDLLSSYAKYLLKLPELILDFRANSQGLVDDTLNLKFKRFAGIAVALPPLPEQGRISEILTSVDEAIQATEAVIEQTKGVKQGLLTRLLTRGIGHSRFQTTKIGKVPEGWKVVPISEICFLGNGHGFSAIEWSDEGLPIIRIQNLNGSRAFNYFSGQAKEEWIVEPGMLLFAWAGVKGVSFGPCVWNGPRGVLNQHIYRVREATGVSREFLYLLLRQVTAKIEANAHGFKASLLHVRKSDILSQLVALPPTYEQNQISRAMSDQQAQIDLGVEALDCLQTLKRGLLSDLLSGRVRVKVPRA